MIDSQALYAAYIFVIVDQIHGIALNNLNFWPRTLGQPTANILHEAGTVRGR